MSAYNRFAKKCADEFRETSGFMVTALSRVRDGYPPALLPSRAAHNRGGFGPRADDNPKHAASPSPLRGPVGMAVAPCRHRRLIAPERKREQLAGLSEGLESLDRQEAVDFEKFVAQSGGEIQIGLALAFRRPDLEDHRNHGRISRACGSESFVRKIRSSRRIKPSLRANSKASRPASLAFSRAR